MKIIITENQLERVNKILDKISTYGIESLTKIEREFLDKESKGIEDEELSDLIDIDSGYEIKGEIDGMDVKYVYSSTEEWDDTPPEYKHEGYFYITDVDGTTEYFVCIYTNGKYKYQSFDLHDGDDYVEFDDDFEDKLSKFFKKVSIKLAKTM